MNTIYAKLNNNIILNSKGQIYYKSSLDANLDFFAATSRNDTSKKIKECFADAYIEDKKLALANLLYALDIRSGKGERRIFKKSFITLCNHDKESALKVLKYIPTLGRYDYILKGLHSLIEDEVVDLIDKQLKLDIVSDNPSLLAKWLPSLKTHDRVNEVAKYLIKKLNISEKEYRKTLSTLRSKINIVEKNLTNKDYFNIDYNNVPSKAMLKYQDAFLRNDNQKYNKYLLDLKKGDGKVNTKGLFSYEIIKKVNKLQYGEKNELLDEMWKNQKDVLNGLSSNVLVMADTSGSMTYLSDIPISTSIGLAIYIAQRNTGIFKDCFITFASKPKLVKLKGESITEIVRNIRCINDNTNIDAAFKMLLNKMVSEKVNKKDEPSHIVIISDMEFDCGVYSKNSTNFEGWKKAFKEKGYSLPKIIFWNVACKSGGLAATKMDNDVIMVSGFSTNILENIFNLDNYNPKEYMLEVLEKYLKML